MQGYHGARSRANALARRRWTRHHVLLDASSSALQVGQTRRRVIAAWFILATALLAVPGFALRVQLRARTRLELVVVPAGGELEVRGALRDSREQPVANAAVALLVAGSPPPAETHRVREDLVATTAADGRFAVRVPLGDWLGADRLAHVEARFAGGPTLGEATAETLFDLRKQDAALELHAQPTQLRTDSGDLELTAEVRSGDLPLAALEVQWAVDGKPVVVSRSDGDGIARAVLPATALGAPGPRVVSAHLAGNEQVNEADASLQIDLLGAVQVDLVQHAGNKKNACAAAGAQLADADWCLEGRVRTARLGAWRPVVNAAVSLHMERHLLATLTTDVDGRFFAVARGDALTRLFPPGAVGLVARAQVPEPWHEIGWSPVVSLEIPPPPELSSWLYAVPLLALIAAVVVQRWRARRRELALQAWREASSAGLPDEHVRSIAAGEPSRRLRGRVVHGETGRPCASTLVLQSRENPEQVTRIAVPDGDFDVAELPAGRYLWQVHADEHMTLEFALELPHDGFYDGCELLPASCRAVVRGTFSASVRSWTQKPVDWTRETPRDVEPRVTGAIRRGHADLRDAVRRVERALYGRRTDADVADAARSALNRVEEGQ